MQFQLIRSWQDFDGLAGEWNALLALSDDNNIFLCWEWVSTWRALFGHEVTPFVIIARDLSGQLIGIAPLYLTKMTFAKLIPYRLLLVMGSEEVGADYASFISHRNGSSEIQRGLLKALLKNRAGWDCIWLTRSKGWTPSSQEFVKVLSTTEKLSFMQRTLDFPMRTLSLDSTGFEKSLSKNMRSNLKKLKNKIQDYEIVQCQSLGETAQYLEVLYDLHYKRWQLEGGEGAFNRRERMKVFYEAFVPEALEKGWLRFYQLRVNGIPQATQIGYLYDEVFYVIQEGFNPDAPNGIGNLLRYHVMDATIHEQVSEYDFLADNSTHKRRWSTEVRLGRNLFIWNNNVRNIFLNLRKLWPSGRYLSY